MIIEVPYPIHLVVNGDYTAADKAHCAAWLEANKGCTVDDYIAHHTQEIN